MMPAASNKVEPKPSVEVQEPIKQSVNLVEKKVRNLEKRKRKLDAIRDKKSAGGILDKEQQDAIEHYDEVITNLEFARELSKQILGFMTEGEKLQKKQAKREKQERTASELKRVVEILQVQTTLDSLGSDTVREHFKTGKHGAVVLTDDNLAQLDELFQLISPSREGTENFEAVLAAAGDHLLSLLESRDRPVVGSTYKELRELITLINDCGYFERARLAGSEEPTEEEKGEPEPEEDLTPSSHPPPVETFHDTIDEPEQDLPIMVQAASLEDSSLPHSQVMQSGVPQEPASYYNPVVSAAYQPAASLPEPVRIRPIDEIVSSVQGTFNFLQDSVIEMDSPHMDPAVVASQPMMRPPSSTQPPGGILPPSAFPPGHFPDVSSVEQSSLRHDGESQDPLSLSQQSNLDFTSGQTFVQAGLSHSQNLSAVNDVLFQSAVEDSSGNSSASQQRVHNIRGQQIGAGEPASQFDLAASISLPTSQSQDGPQLGGQEKKFQMNASAPVFQSMYTQSSMPAQHIQHNPPQPSQTQQDVGRTPSAVTDFTTAPPNFAQAAGDFGQGNHFQNSGFQQRGNRGGGGGPGNFRGGQRGGTARGGNGGSTYQGFPPRSDYRPDGYQGYNNSNGFGGSPSSYQKRGGAGGGGGGGFPRGSNSRGAGGMRGGGAPRGAGGPPRGTGTNRGGITRSVNSQ